jgi:hypothetical protein
MPTLYQIIITALISAFIILFLGRTNLRIKLRDFCDVHGISLIAEMLDCDFCLSFWMCLCIALCVCDFTIFSLIAAICAVPITRMLL